MGEKCIGQRQERSVWKWLTCKSGNMSWRWDEEVDERETLITERVCTGTTGIRWGGSCIRLCGAVALPSILSVAHAAQEFFYIADGTLAPVHLDDTKHVKR
eukprot:766825-Hanusia_phi.AAC.3